MQMWRGRACSLHSCPQRVAFTSPTSTTLWISSRSFASTDKDNLTFRTELKLPSWLTSRLSQLKPPIQGPPSPIQRLAVPHIRTAWPPRPVKDVLVQDVTGSGKTLAYLLPILAEVDNYDRRLQVVIVVPSKQMAHQIKNIADLLCAGGKKNRMRNPIIIQQMSSEGLDPFTRSRLGELDEEERVPHVLIGTPGVIAEYLLDPDFAPALHLRHLVLDEVDYLLNLPAHRGALRTILQARQNFRQDEPPPQQSLTLDPSHNPERLETAAESARLETVTSEPLETATTPSPEGEGEEEAELVDEWRKLMVTKVVGVSATITEAVHDWAKSTLTPGYVFCTPDKALISATQAKRRNSLASLPSRIHHFYLRCDKRMETLPILCEWFRDEWRRHYKASSVTTRPRHPKIMVFFEKWDKPLVAQLQYIFKKRDWKVGVLSEFSSRHESREAMADDVQILLTTDLLSRGIDFTTLSHVINYHVPKRTNAYIHRAGRVGRLSGANVHNCKVVSILGHEGQEQYIERFARNLALDIKKVTVDYETGHIDFPVVRAIGGYRSNRQLQALEKRKQGKLVAGVIRRARGQLKAVKDAEISP
eukprot:g64098.t1